MSLVTPAATSAEFFCRASWMATVQQWLKFREWVGPGILTNGLADAVAVAICGTAAGLQASAGRRNRRVESTKTCNDCWLNWPDMSSRHRREMKNCHNSRTDPFIFTAFKNELNAHRDGGYHRLGGPLQRSNVDAWFAEHALKAPAALLDFLCRVGPGTFFGGALTIYPLSSDRWRSVESELAKLRKVSVESICPFGYDGTTESCYCFEASSGRDEVYWFSWEEKVKRSSSANFQEWIEAKPKELFKEQIYAGYRKLTNVDALVSLMDERAAFTVRLVSFDKQLQRPSDKSNDMLPRYNKLKLEVTKTRPVTIPVLTVIVARLGSKLGAANVEYVTFPVSDIPVDVPTIRECYVFDPFNVPFASVEVKFNPVIDLGSKMRVRFKEIADFLV